MHVPVLDFQELGLGINTFLALRAYLKMTNEGSPAGTMLKGAEDGKPMPWETDLVIESTLFRAYFR